jgi:TRAP-type C4-dicarboxylate transport system permease small subunit
VSRRAPAWAWADKALGGLAALSAGIGAAALAGLFIVVLVAVIMRYVWGRPYAGSEELAGLLMTVAVFSMWPVTVLRDQHIRVTIAVDRLGGWPRRVVVGLGHAVLLAFLAVFGWQAWAIASFTAQLNLLAEHSRLPLAPFLFGCVALVGLAGAAAAWRAVVALPAAPDSRPAAPQDPRPPASPVSAPSTQGHP